MRPRRPSATRFSRTLRLTGVPGRRRAHHGKLRRGCADHRRSGVQPRTGRQDQGHRRRNRLPEQGRGHRRRGRQRVRSQALRQSRASPGEPASPDAEPASGRYCRCTTQRSTAACRPLQTGSHGCRRNHREPLAGPSAAAWQEKPEQRLLHSCGHALPSGRGR